MSCRLLQKNKNAVCNIQGSETRVDTPKTWRVVWVNPPKKHNKKPTKTHPKFNPVSFLVLLITKDFIMFKALEKL